MIELIVGGWLVSGAAGAFAIWLADSGPLRNLTPRALLLIGLVSMLGPVMVFAAGVTWLAEWNERDPERLSWWSRPIWTAQDSRDE